MSKANRIISPIAIDLGAKSTGVYFAHYPENCPIEDIDREGVVYKLGKDSYTLLMVARTAARHQKRRYDRKQMVKRLFKLIWENHFGLDWDDNVQQATSFLFNRRGFSFLTEEYNPEILSQFPQDAYEKLPEGFKGLLKKLKILREPENNSGEYDFAEVLTELSNLDKRDVERIYNSINKKPQRIESIKRINALRDYCNNQLTEAGREKNKDKKRAAQLYKSDLEELRERGTLDLPSIPNNRKNIDITKLEISENQARRIVESIPSDIEKEGKELKKEGWEFKCNRFDTEDFDKAKEDEVIRTHLHHLAFALYKVHNERISGARHRKDYFEEVEAVLTKNNHTHPYLKDFCKRLNQGEFGELNSKSFTNLICHLSNLELKPLRKYFNDLKHKKGDYWRGEKCIKGIFEHWIIKQWRVGEKDKYKRRGEKGDYEELKDQWKTYQKERLDTVVDFWLNTDPFYTIPPYQDINNRRPPRCQSLILHAKSLNKKYKKWREWLQFLKDIPSVKEYLGDYETNLRSIGGKSYFVNDGDYKSKYKRTQDEMEARLLQFILDRAKNSDPLKLNQIYSWVKKYQQNESTPEEKKQAKEKLEEAIKNSKLPGSLITNGNYDNDSVFDEQTFLHLVNRYYQLRQKARDGRLYIHPKYRYIKGRGYENTRRYDDKDCLLTYCNHKPRQKRYQMLDDLAALLQISTKDLNNLVKDEEGDTPDEKLFNWLKDIESLKTNCERAAKEQKERKGYLKFDVQRTYGIIHHRKQSDNPNSKEIKKILKKSRVVDAEKLYRFCKKAKSLLIDDVFEGLRKYWGDELQEKRIDELNKNPASAIYLLAQINNIVFKERTGNANTCAVCSADNAQRMQTIEGNAKASRLSAIPTRVIDGAVMRMARIVGRAIAEHKWKKIEKELVQDKKVCIPIITESNRFEFEPSLRSLKDKAKSGDKELLKNVTEQANIIAEDKDERIKRASQGICPYTGNDIGDDGENDHIIPRSSQWGTLNDEANLIYTSNEGNQHKGETEYSLANLHPKYKQKIFQTTNDEEIKAQIIEKVDDKEGEDFKFGKYLNFSQLDKDEQIAFQHALFLEKGHLLRDKVINAIDNRNRTLVNGTQRYFAEVLANALYKKAKDKHHLLSFDYFGVEAWSNNRGDSIKELREHYERIDNVLQEHKKEPGKQQEPYSHLIDAQMAFAIIANKHQNGGSLKLQIDENIRLWPYNKNTGEVHDRNIFDSIKVTLSKTKEAKLGKRKVYDIETHHRQLINRNKRNQIQISYKIHRDSIISERFLPLLKSPDEIKKGFHPTKNATQYKEKDFNKLLDSDLLEKCKNTHGNYEVWIVKKKEAQEFLMATGYKDKGANKEERKICKLLDNLSYQTVKKSIQSVLSIESNDSVEVALEVWDTKISENNFKKDKVTLPCFYEWEKLKSLLERANKDQSLQEFLKDCDMFRTKKNQIREHGKVRKIYSLPVISTIGSIRLKRRTWRGDTIIQTVPEENLAKYGDCRPHTILSKNSIPKKHYDGCLPDELEVISRDWVDVTDKIKNNKGIIEKTKIQYQDAGRSRVQITVNEIEKLSVPREKNRWEGKIKLYENSSDMEKAQANDQNNHHCLKDEFYWFDEPFRAVNLSRKIGIRKREDKTIWCIEFTVDKKIKRLLALLTKHS